MRSQLRPSNGLLQAGWAGASFAVTVSTHTLMSSMTALTYTHAAHISSSHYPPSLLSSSNRGILVQDYQESIEK